MRGPRSWRATRRYGCWRSASRDGGADRATEIAVGILSLAGLVVGALDLGRFHWSHVSPLVRWAALLPLVSGYALRIFAMATNDYFAGTLIIQRERDHRPIERGPYRWLRHPGYAGLILILPSIALVLASIWALIPMLSALALLVSRTVREDRFLHANLAGYPDYARRVRYRLLPWVF